MKKFLSTYEAHLTVRDLSGSWHTCDFRQGVELYYYQCKSIEEEEYITKHYLGDGRIWEDTSTPEFVPRKETAEEKQQEAINAAEALNLTPVEGVRNCSDAKAYLKANFGLRLAVKSKQDIIDIAQEHGVYFPNLPVA